jgi:hypothetical protein
MWYAVELVILAIIAGGICIWLVDRTNKKSYKANDWEIFRVLIVVLCIMFGVIGFALFG